MIGERGARSENLQERGPLALGSQIQVGNMMVFNKYSMRFKYSVSPGQMHIVSAPPSLTCVLKSTY